MLFGIENLQVIHLAAPAMLAMVLATIMNTNQEETPNNIESLKERIDELNVANSHLNNSLERYRKIIAQMPIPCIGVDVDGNLYELNQAAEATFGFGLFDHFEQPIEGHVVPSTSQSEFRSKIQQAVSTDEEVQFEMEAKRGDGTKLIGQWNLVPLRGASGQIASVLITCIDITERVLEQQRLEELAHKDGLTGLFNRRAILGRLNEEHAQVSGDNPLSVILFDIDKFKVFNDTYGHPAGDALLQRAGQILKDLCQEPIMPGRYGGEEFIIVLPGLHIHEAVDFAQTVRTSFQARTTDLNGGATASFGVSTVDSIDDLRVEDLIQSADKALYAAKHAGRNRVMSALSDFEENAA